MGAYPFCPYRWASRVRVSGCVRAAFRFIFAVIRTRFERFSVFFVDSNLFFVAIYMDFKDLFCFSFDSTTLGGHDLQQHLVK